MPCPCGYYYIPDDILNDRVAVREQVFAAFAGESQLILILLFGLIFNLFYFVLFLI